MIHNRTPRPHIIFVCTRSTRAMSLWETELVSPSSQEMVTSLQDVPTTVPRSVIVAPQHTRSPTLRVLDCSPVMLRTSLAKPGPLHESPVKRLCPSSVWRYNPRAVFAIQPSTLPTKSVTLFLAASVPICSTAAFNLSPVPSCRNEPMPLPVRVTL
jgi:hypothetical protein